MSTACTIRRRTWSALQTKPLYVVVEKILAAHERLPETWPVHGTTGYEFAALTTSWLVCNEYEARMTRRYRQFTESDATFEQIAYESRRLVMRASLAAEIEVLATQLDRIAQLDRHTADFTRAAIREAIREVIACFPVYRTYVSHRGVSDEDRRIVNWAVNVARKRSVGAELSVFDFLRDVLLGERGEDRSESMRRAMLEFAMKFQQVTSPVAAKGVEDTALYRYNRLVCLNEVGNDPGRFGTSSAALHQANAERARAWPHSMLATSTHDTKRSEDVRARIAVLSELPDLWKLHLARWTRLNRSKRRQVGDDPAPDREDEYLLYQTLIGVWSPTEDAGALTERLQAYAVKAAREAKRSTSWIAPNAEYEKALGDFIARAAGRSGAQRVPEGFPHARANRGVLRAHQLAGADSAQDRLAGHARFLPGHGAAGADARRSRQSASRRFRRSGTAPGRRSSACRDRRASCCGSRMASRASST